MSRILIGLRSVYICASVSFLCSAQSPTFLPLAKTVVWRGNTQIVPRWSNGAFITVDGPLSQSTATISADPNVFISGDQGNTTIPIRIPGALWTQNRGAARASDGTIAVSGEAKDGSGHPWFYLAFFGPRFEQPTVLRTDPYEATAIAFAPDGTVWTKGAEWTPPEADGVRRYNQKSANGILRHFDRSGILLGSAIPQSGLTTTQAVWGDSIASTANRVGWCQYRGFVVGKQPQGGSYFEVSANGAVTKTALPTFAEGETIDSLAILDNGQVFITKTLHGAHAELYALDRNVGEWHLVQFPAAGFEGTGYYMLGATGNKVAFWTKGTSGFTAQFAEVR